MKTILLAVMNNRDVLPNYFVKSLMEMQQRTKGALLDIRFFNAVDINVMRNLAVSHAINGKYDYIMQLDTDMAYPSDTINRLLKRNKPVVMGTAKRRSPPFHYVHCKKLKKNFLDEKNILEPKGKKLMRVEVSGVPGALIKTKVFKRIKYPYFLVCYQAEKIYGGDIYFCKQLKKAKIPIWIDPTLSYDHKVDFLIGQGGFKSV